MLLETGNFKLLSKIPNQKIPDNKLKEIQDLLLKRYKLFFPLVLPAGDVAVLTYIEVKYNKYSRGNILDTPSNFRKIFIKMLHLAISYLTKNNKNMVPYLDWRNFDIEIPLLNQIDDNSFSYNLALFIAIINAIVKNEIRDNFMLSGVFSDKEALFIEPDKVPIKKQACKREFGDNVSIIIPDKNMLSPEEVITTVFGQKKLIPQFDYSIEDAYYRIRNEKDDQYKNNLMLLYNYLKKKRNSVKAKNIALKVIYRIAEYYNHTGELTESIKYYKKTLDKYKRMKKNKELYPDNEIYDIMNSFGVLLMDLYRYKEAENILKDNLMQKKKILTEDQVARTLGSLGQLYTYRNDLKKGEKILIDVISILNKMERNESIRDMIYLSYNYILQNKFHKANELLRKSTRLANRILSNKRDLEIHKCYIYNNLILCNYLSKNYRDSIKKYNSISKIEDCPDFVEAHIKQYVGYSYIIEEEIQKGTDLLTESIDVYRKLSSFDTDMQILKILIFCMEHNNPLENIVITKEINSILDKNREFLLNIGIKINDNFDLSINSLKKTFSFIRI